MWDITETMEQIRIVVENLIQMCGITGVAVPVVRYVSMSLAAIFFSWLSYIIAKKLLIPVIDKITARTKATWDEVLLNHDVLLKVCAIVPAVVIYKLLPLVFFEAPFVQEMLNRLTSIYITVTSVQLGVVHGGIGKFLMIFAVTQIPLAIAEGLLTVVVFNVLEKYSREELPALCVL